MLRGRCEAAAANFGVLLARRLGLSRVLLECDSMRVVQAIACKQTGASPIFLFFENVVCVSSSFDYFKCVHVKRVGNTVAHLVARWPTTGANELVMLDQFPQSIQTLVDWLNMLGFPLKKKEAKRNV